MAEYIELEALLKKLAERDLCLCVSESDIKDIPAADVSPVVHGRWIKGVPVGFSGKPDGYRCSVCETVILGMTPLYCQRCGSKIDKEDTDGLDTP